MRNRECVNCGSTEFHQVENGWKCDYCGTLYLDPENTATKQKRSPRTPQQHKKRRITGLVAVVFILIGLSLNYLVFKSDKSDSGEAISYEPLGPELTDSSTPKKFPGKWTQSIYKSVKAATEHYHDDTEKYTFEGGSSYEELEKLVGKPDTVISWEKEDYGMPPRTQATWDKTSDGEYTGNSISVTYEKNTMMIIDKDSY
ncbi:hypothetical protein [Enterococcus pingfangensis]